MAWTTVNGTVKTDLNIRSGAGTNYGVVSVIPSGASVQVTGPAVNGWYPVAYNGKTGWSKASYFKPLPAQPAPAPTPPAPVPGTNTATPFYDPNSAYGNPLGNQSSAPIVTDKQEWAPEFSRWTTMKGVGGIGSVASNIRQNLEPRLQSGFGAAKLNNPGLQPRNYFEGLGGSFIKNAAARMTPSQLTGRSYGTLNPLVRKNPR